MRNRSSKKSTPSFRSKPMARDWTVNPATGRANDSARFKALAEQVARLIRGDAHTLLTGRADRTAGLIMAQLAHVHGLVPSRKRRKRKAPSDG